MGTRAFSHESIFIPDGRAESEESIQAMSQENILGKVKTLQSCGTPDSLSPASLRGIRHEVEEKVAPVKSSSRPKRHHSPSGTIETVNLDAIPLVIAHLDNSAAKHKLSVKPKNQRVSKKHRRLSKELQSGVETEFEQEFLESKYKDNISKHEGHHVVEKVTQRREGHEQKGEGKRKLEDPWRTLEAEKKTQMAEAEVKSHMEYKRPQELEESLREQEGKKQKLQVEEQILKTEERKDDEEEKRYEEQRLQDFCIQKHTRLEKKEKKEERPEKLEEQVQQAEEGHQELKEQKQSNHVLEPQRYQEASVQGQLEEPRHQELVAPMQLEEQKHQEMEAQRQLEEQRCRELEAQRQLEEKKHQELEAQRQLEEQKCQEMEAQGQLEEQRCQELEAQRQLKEQIHQELLAQRQLEERKQQELTAQRQQGLEHQKEDEEKRYPKSEEGKIPEKLLQHGWKDKGQEKEKQKWQEANQRHEDLEEWNGQVLEEQRHKAENQDELNQQELQVWESQVDQRTKEVEKTRNQQRLQGKEKATKLQKKPEEQPQSWEAEQSSKNEQKLQERDTPVLSAETGKFELAKLKHPRADQNMPHEGLLQRGERQKVEEQKSLIVERHQRPEKTKEEAKSIQLRLGKSMQSGEKQLEAEKKEEASHPRIKQAGKGQKEEETLSQNKKSSFEAKEQERILGEELRWQEIDARKTMPRGFTFQVSSGEKQIIFQKVNLSPVTLAKESPAPSAAKELMAPKSSKGPHELPTSLCVPHTAILVTGAQLCGTAVNLSQIKDTACKSLLGLTEERKLADLHPPESIQKMSPDAKTKNIKMKHVQEPLGNQGVLAEWASIRSKILKNAENGKLNEREKGSLSRYSDDLTPKGRSASHGHLRKTLSANAKFSITPAWQKFSEISKMNVGTENKLGPEAEGITRPTLDANQGAAHGKELSEAANIAGKPTKDIEVHHEEVDNTEGCKFAKDLPSFLVPSVQHSLSKESPRSDSFAGTEFHQNVTMRKQDRPSPNKEENVSPFGVKLRRTNYSLRFHYDQQAEQKKKKRYSAGDSFDGVPTPLVTPDDEKAAARIISEEYKSPSQETKNAVNLLKSSSPNVNQNYTTAAPVTLSATSNMSAVCQEKPVGKLPPSQKPALAPKPTSQTPPSSPLSKMRRPHLSESLGQRVAKAEPDSSWRRTEAKGSTSLSQGYDERKSEDDESREKKSFFPSITMPWREKTEKKPELLKKDRPILQSRHSIDGSKMMEKIESAQPLWITLALQKQKGFREQQATREERRQAREAKQAEKLAKENASTNSHTDNKSSSVTRTSTLLKPTTQEEEKKVETAMTRLERREHLKKSNTLPSSVTVEISDSISPSPLAKEVTKRVSNPDANPMSSEPAWLALAKRKAKAWSDCPQIIK